MLCENLRENCSPVVLKFAPKKVGDMFKALGIPPEYTPDPLPRSFSPAEAGRIERVMRGEPERPADSNTGGAGWIVEAKQPDALRTLYMDFKAGTAIFFPASMPCPAAGTFAEVLTLWASSTQALGSTFRPSA
ncbi:hypothetical protein AB0D78_40990 [Streptomyces avermitilis]|uniref:hypothetical protein n=1 Tax=Streptomyces avermitilis TaxID=33903 RepID=UPI00340CB947